MAGSISAGRRREAYDCAEQNPVNAYDLSPALRRGRLQKATPLFTRDAEAIADHHLIGCQIRERLTSR